jgi:hypothetical protein
VRRGYSFEDVEMHDETFVTEPLPTVPIVEDLLYLRQSPTSSPPGALVTRRLLWASALAAYGKRIRVG